MSENFKPGDFALVNGCRCIRTDDNSWEHGRSHAFRFVDHRDLDVRRLVVIDPESSDADLAPLLSMGSIENVRDVLRHMANPTPPKPDEPTGLGAVVEDADGVQWLKQQVHRDCNDWIRFGALSSLEIKSADVLTYYRDINAVRVLSEGVQS